MSDAVLERIDNNSIPHYAIKALSLLENAGFEAWLVGGFVRDRIIGRECSDIDIACSAHWTEAKEVFSRAGLPTYEVGVKHGTLTVVLDDSPSEVTTYRADGLYKDSRHPESVRFVSSIEEDLARRDFSINALAYHPVRGFVDAFGGLADIEAGIIRAVGNPKKRFEEDALRILRACRFASQLGFTVEDDTLSAMISCKSRLGYVSTERLTHEIEGLLLGDYVHHAIMSCVDVLTFAVPELSAMKGFDQKTPYHIYDVLEHTAWVVQNTPADRLTRWAAFLHDMGKPAAAFEDGEVRHFYGHAQVSVVLGRALMDRLLISPAFRDQVLLLVKRHDDVVEGSPRAVKRMLVKLNGDVELFRKLCDIKRADALSQAPRCTHRAEEAEKLKLILDEVLAASEPFSLKHLAINGNDILKLGVKPGPHIGEILNAALDSVIEERIANERDELIEFASSMVKELA